jgi:Major capsid protein GP7
MATIGSNVLTLADWAKRQEDERVAAIVELLSQTNEIIDDMLWIEGNLPTGHKTTVRTGLPQATWRLLNYGVPQGKSTTAQIIDTCGDLEVYGQVDKKLADLNGNSAEFRLSEVRAFLEGMNQQFASTLMYGNTAVNPERFMGFAPRYNSVSTATAQTAANVIDMGGTASTNTSIWIVCWGSDTAHGIFPKGMMTGLQHKDLGEWPLTDANGNRFQGYLDHYQWDCGLTVRDWRYTVRLANIDVALLNGANAANIINGLIRGLRRLPTGSSRYTAVQSSDAPSIQGEMGRIAIYANRVVSTYLDLQAANKTNVLLDMREYEGHVITTFRGAPVRTVDAILNTEARLT